MTVPEIQAVRSVARIISRHYDAFAPADRITLLEGLAILLPNDEGIAASQAAFMLRKSEEHQLKFHDLLQNPQ